MSTTKTSPRGWGCTQDRRARPGAGGSKVLPPAPRAALRAGQLVATSTKGITDWASLQRAGPRHGHPESPAASGDDGEHQGDSYRLRDSATPASSAVDRPRPPRGTGAGDVTKPRRSLASPPDGRVAVLAIRGHPCRDRRTRRSLLNGPSRRCLADGPLVAEDTLVGVCGTNQVGLDTPGRAG